MKLKFNVQQPIVIIVLFIVMLISLWFVLMFISTGENVQEDRVPIGLKDVRSGDQEISVKVVSGENIEGENQTENQVGNIDILETEETTSDNVDTVYATATQPVNSRFMSAFTAGERVKFKIDKFQKLAAQPLKFEIFDESGQAITPNYLSSIQGQKVHFYLVHANLKEFHHIIPEYKNDVWNVLAEMPTEGTYHAYIVLDSLKDAPIAYRYDLVVREESAEDIAFPYPSENLEFFDGTQKAKMNMQRLESGRMFGYTLTKDEIGLNPEPYLESFGQLTVFKHGDANAFATTPSTLSGAGDVDSIFFSLGNLLPGRYTAFAEFNLAGKVYVFPITFDVGTV